MKLATAFSLALPGGHAPACQERDLGKATSSSEALTRSCAWTKSLCTASIKVHEGPLLGTCLAEMTGATPEPLQPKDEARPRPTLACAEETRRRGVRDSNCIDADHVAKSSGRSDSPCAPSAKGSEREAAHFSCRPRTLPEQTQTVVDRETLRRIAQHKDSENVLSLRKPGTSAISHLKRTASTDIREVSPTAAARVHREWIRQLSQRAVLPVKGQSAEGFLPKGKRESVSVSERKYTASENLIQGPTADLDLTQKQAHSANASSLAASAFPPSWSTPLDGQQYPQERLAHLASGLEPPSFVKKQSPVAEPDRKRLPVPPTARSVSIPADQERSDNDRPPSQNKLQSASDSVAVNQLEHTTQPGLEPVPVRRPRSIPGLVRHHTPLVEEVPSCDEQLSTLAANIQRILDEEARRHGIDV
jgi:hypothetical protein